MAYFRCGQGNGGGGADLTIFITTDSSSLYGLPITITKNGSIVGTTVFDSSGEATYIVDEPGTYVVSVTLGGNTFTDTVEVTDTFAANIEALPDGSTVTPTDNIPLWLQCGGIFDKNYTLLSEILNDTTTLLALISSNNASDYMKRSRTWISDVVADSTAMTYIGANNYCSNALLSDIGTGGWLEGICGSSYFESVLNTKVPTMTSNTTPSGEVTASSESANAYVAFDGQLSSGASWVPSAGATDNYIRYQFPDNVDIYKSVVTMRRQNSQARTINLQYSEDGVTYTNGESISIAAGSTDVSETVIDKMSGSSFGIFCQDVMYVSGSWILGVWEIEFYGRTAV